MGRATFSRAAYTGATAALMSSGRATTHAAEERVREGKGLHEYVDLRQSIIKRSLSFKEPAGSQFKLLRGIAMPIIDLLDTTGSMGSNVDIAMKVLPDTYEHLAQKPYAVLKDYDVHSATAIFGDYQTDPHVLQFSQFEFDERIGEQMGYMSPFRRGGGNGHENPEYGLYQAAFLVDAHLWNYGLKGYLFLTTDEPGAEKLTRTGMDNVYGDTDEQRIALDDALTEMGGKLGYSLTHKDLVTSKFIVSEMLKRWHGFVLQIDADEWPTTTRYMNDRFGAERVVRVYNSSLLPLYKTAIIGLTEGVYDLEGTVLMLRAAGASEKDAQKITEHVSGIPIGAQAELRARLPHSLPKAGDLFAQRADLWPTTVPAETSKKKSAWA
jgi:hypothetical protein